MKAYLIRALRDISETPRRNLLARRYEKYRRMGVVLEAVGDEETA